MRTRIPSLLLPAVLAADRQPDARRRSARRRDGLLRHLADGGEGEPNGSGTAAITIDPDTGQVCWDLSVDGVADVTASHIHVGAEGESGDVVVPLDVDGFRAPAVTAWTLPTPTWMPSSPTRPATT